MEHGMDFATACLVVNKENEQRRQMLQHLQKTSQRDE
jgi:hypothetical protein